jgi:hypothetical protein
MVIKTLSLCEKAEIEERKSKVMNEKVILIINYFIGFRINVKKLRLLSAVIWSLTRDSYIMRVALVHSGISDLHKFRFH